jgi:hypothetical protein
MLFLFIILYINSLGSLIYYTPKLLVTCFLFLFVVFVTAFDSIPVRGLKYWSLISAYESWFCVVRHIYWLLLTLWCRSFQIQIIYTCSLLLSFLSFPLWGVKITWHILVLVALLVVFPFFIYNWNTDCFIVVCIVVLIVLLLCYYCSYYFYSGTSLTLLRSVLHLDVCLCRNELGGCSVCLFSLMQWYLWCCHLAV